MYLYMYLYLYIYISGSILRSVTGPAPGSWVPGTNVSGDQVPPYHVYIHTYILIYIYIYLFIYVHIYPPTPCGSGRVEAST